MPTPKCPVIMPISNVDTTDLPRYRVKIAGYEIRARSVCTQLTI